MKAFLITALAAISIGALAQQKPKKVDPKVHCPNCHMEMAKKKDKAHTVAVRLKKGGPIYYCCGGCNMSDKILVKPKKKKG